MLTISTSDGLAAGTGLAQVTVTPLDDLNTAVYGADFDMKTLLSKSAP